MSLRLYIDADLRRDAEIELPAPAIRHVQVRRLQPGDALVLFDGRGGEWSATVSHMGRGSAGVRVGDFVSADRELGPRVTVALGMPANERMDLLVEKATELGVHTIQPLLCERSVLRLAGDRALRKREHWQAIAVAAAEQCRRTQLPQVAPVLLLERWLALLDGDGDGVRVLLSPREGAAALRTVVGGHDSVTTLSGPEGGLTADEESAALLCGFVAARLGPRVLRAETAPLAVLAWIGSR
jgi:16S rRNA (uracil1498-N3)-methyltransferase